MKKTVVITGCGGRLGQQFISCYQNTYNIYGISNGSSFKIKWVSVGTSKNPIN